MTPKKVFPGEDGFVMIDNERVTTGKVSGVRYEIGRKVYADARDVMGGKL